MTVSNAIEVGFRAQIPDGLVDLGALACPGCGSAVVDEPPIGWPAAAGQAPEFSHRDGSVLCPDQHGRLGEPYEIGGPGPDGEVGRGFGRVAS